jgi:hypothetical protein
MRNASCQTQKATAQLNRITAHGGLLPVEPVEHPDVGAAVSALAIAKGGHGPAGRRC